MFQFRVAPYSLWSEISNYCFLGNLYDTERNRNSTNTYCSAIISTLSTLFACSQTDIDNNDVFHSMYVVSVPKLRALFWKASQDDAISRKHPYQEAHIQTNQNTLYIRKNNYFSMHFNFGTSQSYLSVQWRSSCAKNLNPWNWELAQ